MIKTNYLIVLFLISSFIVQGQNSIKEFGIISNDEIELKEYALDKDAEALVLYDMAKSYFVETSNSYNVVFERTTRIKILSEAGIKWAEVEIPFYQEGEIFEEVYDIKASSYNSENGRLNKSQFNISNAYDEKKNEYWNIKKFAIPNVKEGSVIEYTYKINSQYIFNFRDWEFQWKIPVVYSEYEVKMLPLYDYAFILQGAGKFDVKESYEDDGAPRYFNSQGAYGNRTYHDMVYKFGMKNIPAFNDEEFISSINDYIIKLDFQLSKIHKTDGTNIDILGTWEALIKDLLKHQDFGNYIHKSEKLTSKLFDTNDIRESTETEKFNLVLDYIKSNYNWDNYTSKFASKTPNKLVDEKFGNCADLNLFAIGLLNGMGIEAVPIILSTRDHGKINPDYPFSHFFNYVVVLAKVNGKLILADATEILCTNDRIPPRCINDKGLIIQKNKVEWIGLECLLHSSVLTFIHMDINENVVHVDLSKEGTEYDALFFRNNYSDNIEVVKQKLSLTNYSIIDSTILVQNQLEKTKPYKLRYSFNTKPEFINNKIYISPFLNESISNNPLKQKERKYSIDMIYPKKRIFRSTFSIPEDFQLDFVPEELKINNELFELDYSIKINDNMISVSLDYFFKKSVYKPGDYSKIKYYFREIVKKGNEKIVLSKKITESN